MGFTATLTGRLQMAELGVSLLVALIVLAAVGTPASATSYVVESDGTGDFPTIQAAIDAVSGGDIILLSPGTFTGSGNRDIDFGGKAITVRSQPINAEICIIDCEDGALGFVFQTGEGPGSVLQGVTITRGFSFDPGAGIRCAGASPTIRDCIISNCQSEWGAVGMAVSDTSAAPVVSYCTFHSNYGEDGGVALAVYQSASASLDHCTFYGNADGFGEYGSIVSVESGGSLTMDNSIIAFSASGAAVYCSPGGVCTLTCCDIYGNPDGDWVGGIEDQFGLNGNISEDPRFCYAQEGDFTLHNTSICALYNNPVCGQIGAWMVGCGPSIYVVNPEGTGDFPDIRTALDNVWDGDIIELTDGTFTGTGNHSIGFQGKAVTVRSQGGDPRNCIIDCESNPSGFYFISSEGPGSVLEGVTIVNMLSHDYYAGAIHCDESSPTITNCIISNCRSSSDGGGIVCMSGASPVVSYCTFVNNSGDYGGGGAIIRDTTVHMSHCTFSGNDSGGSACIFVFSGGTLTLDNSIIASTVGGPAIECGQMSSATLTCCDLSGNEGGDWVGSIADQFGQDGNISENPRFCNAGAGEFTLHHTSPCAPGYNPSCGQVGAWPVGCGPSIYVVNPEGTGDFPDIRTALDNVWEGDIVELTDGTFTGAENSSIDFQGKAVTVRSQGGDPRNCIIDCESNPYGFYFYSHEGPGSVLEGVTIANMLAYDYYAGAIHCDESSPTITNCIISNCRSLGDGGGIVCMSGASPIVSYCTFVNNTGDYGGGGAMIRDTTVHMSHCTFSGNDSGGSACIFVFSSGTLTLDNSIIASTVGGPAIECGEMSTATLTCCDLFGNEGGDWVDSIADQFGVNGNINEDPLFCYEGNGNLSLQYNSPCAAENNPGCGQIGAHGIGCGFRIISIDDVENDQGRHVRINWGASLEDVPGTEYAITQYNIWRRIDELPAGEAAPAGEAVARSDGRSTTPLAALAYPPGDWDFVKAVPAHGESYYNTVCETLCDSTITDGMCLSTFFIRAATEDPYVYFDCAPDSGYSIDNLAPHPPANLRWDEPSLLAWEEPIDEDFDYFAVYGSESDFFDPLEAELIGHTIGTVMDVTGTDHLYYHATSTDFAGNEGEASTIEKETMAVEEIKGLPNGIVLLPCHPNPFNPATVIRYDLPAAVPARLGVYDPAGRLVRQLVMAEMHQPGKHWIEWDGRDSEGQLVGSGVYFYRLDAGSFTMTRSMVLLK